MYCHRETYGDLKTRFWLTVVAGCAELFNVKQSTKVKEQRWINYKIVIRTHLWKDLSPISAKFTVLAGAIGLCRCGAEEWVSS